MDHVSVAFSQKRFQEVKRKLEQVLKKIGYTPELISIIPISAQIGNNIITKSYDLEWFMGHTLINTIESIETPKRDYKLPLRITLQDCYRVNGQGTIGLGKIECGVLKKGTPLYICPLNMTSSPCLSIENHHVKLEEAHAGDYIGVLLKQIPSKQVKRGFVISELGDDIACKVARFTARI